MYETAITRQAIPNTTFYPPLHGSGIHPPSGASSLDLTPPSSDPGWRFRHMEILPASRSTPGYTVPSSSGGCIGGYTVPSSYEPQPTDVLVIWERYKESV